MPMPAQPPAVFTAAVAHRTGTKCNYIIDDKMLEQILQNKPAQFILTVDYSRAALTTPLVVKKCSVFEVHHVLHNTNLGTDALSKGFNTLEFCSTNIGVMRALRHITGLPLKDGNGAGLKQIYELVTLGESANLLPEQCACRSL